MDRPLDGATFKDFLRGRKLRNGVCGNTYFHYAGFVPGDLFDGVAEELDVVDAKTCNPSDRRVGDYVGAVVFSANATFNNGSVDLFTYVGVEGHDCKEAEVGGFGGLVGGLPLCSRTLFKLVPSFPKVLGKELFRQRLIVDANPLSDEA